MDLSNNKENRDASSIGLVRDSTFQIPSVKVRCLIPDFPSKDQLEPWLSLIDSNCWYTNFGPLIQRLEKEFSQLFQREQQSSIYLTTLSSATTALELGIAALDLPADSRVLVPSFSFPATVTSVLRSGLTPVFADVDASHWTLTAGIAKDAIKQVSYDAVIPVATFGCPVDIDAWEQFAQETGKVVLIDAAATFGNRQWSEHCHAVVSLHATKPFGVGEGGIFISQDSELVERVRSLSNFGFTSDDLIESIGTNGKLSEYHAAVGLAQLQRWPEIQKQRQRVWDAYRSELASYDSMIGLNLLQDSQPPSVFSVQLLCSVNKVADVLAEQGIETRRWYSPALHQHPAFSEIEHCGAPGQKSLTNTEVLDESLIGLPFHSHLSGDDVTTVCRVLREAIGCNAKK